jgi:hypothetical protein
MNVNEMQGKMSFACRRATPPCRQSSLNSTVFRKEYKLLHTTRNNPVEILTAVKGLLDCK